MKRRLGQFDKEVGEALDHRVQEAGLVVERQGQVLRAHPAPHVAVEAERGVRQKAQGIVAPGPLRHAARPVVGAPARRAWLESRPHSLEVFGALDGEVDVLVHRRPRAAHRPGLQRLVDYALRRAVDQVPVRLFDSLLLERRQWSEAEGGKVAAVEPQEIAAVEPVAHRILGHTGAGVHLARVAPQPEFMVGDAVHRLEAHGSQEALTVGHRVDG